jgi:DNA-binding transcriptional LysR family regulator
MARDGVLNGQLHAFVAVARLGNMPRAALPCATTHPTPGARSCPTPRTSSRPPDEGEPAVAATRDEVERELRIDATPTTSAHLLPTVMARRPL